MLHVQREGWELFRVTGEEVEKIPLRHESDELAVGGQPREIGHRDKVTIEDSFQLPHLLMWKLEKFFQQPEFVHQLKCGRMNGVAAKIAVEIGVFLQHRDVHTRARHQVTGHHSSGSATNDDATSADVRRRIHGIWKSILASRSESVDPPNRYSCCLLERRGRWKKLWRKKCVSCRSRRRRDRLRSWNGKFRSPRPDGCRSRSRLVESVIATR